jgi:hypothetical protein
MQQIGEQSLRQSREPRRTARRLNADDPPQRSPAIMTSKSITSLAFAAGCILALGAMPSAQAQTMDQPQVVTNGPQATAGDYG